MELIRFIFSSPWIFLGVVVIILCIGGIICNAIRIASAQRVARNALSNPFALALLKNALKEEEKE